MISKSIHLAGGRVYENGELGPEQDFWVDKGVWYDSPQKKKYTTIDCKGGWILPGLVELSADFCEPGREYVYSLVHGEEAMMRGGFATAVQEPFLTPILDHVAIHKNFRESARHLRVDLLSYSALSLGNQGDRLPEMTELIGENVAGFSNPNLFDLSLEYLCNFLDYASQFSARVHLNPQLASLSHAALVHEGAVADLLGMKGVPAAAESIGVYQILKLAQRSGCPIHLKFISSAESLDHIRKFRSRGLDVTCDVSINNLVMNDSELIKLNSSANLIPPLRDAKDQKAFIKGLKDGTVDAISIQHRPVLPQDKGVNFEDSVPGAVGLETALSVLNTHLSKKMPRGLLDFVDRLTQGPRFVLGIGSEDFCLGAQNPMFLWMPEEEFIVTEKTFSGRVCNSPFMGQKLKGKVRGGIYRGSWVGFEDEV